ncbi:MAG TPA: hypothetical protein VKB75_03420, partial [Jatrophihabitans sp.]|nr:hypothetical protein [Jatrophihabitans sp.]
MFKITKKKALVAGVAAVVIAGGAGAALAFWTTSGSGDGSGSTGTTSQWNVVFQSTDGALSLSPGGPAQTVHFTITNPDPGHAALNRVALTVANPTTAFSARADVNQPACTASDFTISNISLSDTSSVVKSDPSATVTGSPLY